MAIDPSKRKTGGALLGDRIRKNAINAPQIYMRSIATRQSESEVPKFVPNAVEACRAAGFDLVIVETPGIGQGDAAIADLANISLYVMTPEFGAASQLEKIDMLDFADLVAVNKFDRKAPPGPIPLPTPAFRIKRGKRSPCEALLAGYEAGSIIMMRSGKGRHRSSHRGFYAHRCANSTYVERASRNFEADLRNAFKIPKMIVSISGPSKSGKTVLVTKVVAPENLIHIYGASIKTPEDLDAGSFQHADSPVKLARSRRSAADALPSAMSHMGLGCVKTILALLGRRRHPPRTSLCLAVRSGEHSRADRRSLWRSVA